LAELLEGLAGRGVSGGATYDALVAATARSVGLLLMTADQRAEETYRRLGVATEWLTAQ
jgi:toxin FitB